ncbi:MAG: S8 family serine peptidase [Fretibacterium sp.]|nr:S8 family serine peptidase [Fretibacterium sp.]
MKKVPYVSALLLLSLFFCLAPAPLPAAQEGDVLVVLRGFSGTHMTAASLERGTAQTQATLAAQSVGGSLTRTWNNLSEAGNSIFMRVHSSTQSTEQLVKAFSERKDVLAVSPNDKISALFTPDDPYFTDGSLWGLKAIKAPEAWNISTGANVFVAVLDSGVLTQHEDLASNLDLSLSRNFCAPTEGSPVNPDDYIDAHGHGTHVSGIIGAVGNNGLGVIGTAWNVRLITLKVLGADGSGLISYTLDALDYLARLLKERPELRLAAVNLSLGTYTPRAPKNAKKEPYWHALKALDNTNRTLIVVAAGNESLEVGVPAPHKDTSAFPPAFNKGDFCYPASFPWLNNMIVVGALDENRSAPSFTNWSSDYVSLSAPGDSILSCYFPGTKTGKPFSPDSKYGTMKGTSMAAPYVSGAAAILASAYPKLSASQLKAALLRGADSTHNPIPSVVTNPQGKHLSAYGFLDIQGALKYAEQPLSPEPLPTPEPGPYDDPSYTPVRQDSSSEEGSCDSGFSSPLLLLPGVLALFRRWRKTSEKREEARKV